MEEIIIRKLHKNVLCKSTKTPVPNPQSPGLGEINRSMNSGGDPVSVLLSTWLLGSVHPTIGRQPLSGSTLLDGFAMLVWVQLYWVIEDKLQDHRTLTSQETLHWESVGVTSLVWKLLGRLLLSAVGLPQKEHEGCRLVLIFPPAPTLESEQEFLPSSSWGFLKEGLWIMASVNMATSAC